MTPEQWAVVEPWMMAVLGHLATLTSGLLFVSVGVVIIVTLLAWLVGRGS